MSIAAPNLPDAATPGGVAPQISPSKPITSPPKNLLPRMDQKAFKYVVPMNSSPKLTINRFELEGISDKPSMGINKKEIESIVENMRKNNVSGFDIAELRKVTNRIATYYRAKGFFLARAYIPEQRMKNNIVKIVILESKFEKVEVENNKTYKTKQIEKPFHNLFMKPINKASIESALLTLNSYPGLETHNIIVPGTSPGAAILKVSVKKEKRLKGQMVFDNKGSQYTGDYRFLLSGTINNPTFQSDILSFNLLQTVSPSNSLYGSVQYEIPYIPLDMSIGALYSKNQYEVGDVLKILNVNGSSRIARIYIKKWLIRSRSVSLKTQFGLSRKEATVNQITGLKEDKLSVASLSISSSFGNLLGSNTLNVVFSQGIPNFMGTTLKNSEAGGKFSKTNLNYSFTKSLAQLFSNSFFNNQFLFAKFEGQYSKNNLVSLEQSSLGGPSNVRAYAISESLMDKSYFIALEWIAETSPDLQISWLKNLMFSLFIDYAKGWRSNPLPSEINKDLHKSTLSGLGSSIIINTRKGLNTKFDIAYPLTSKRSSNLRKLQYYFTLAYAF